MGEVQLKLVWGRKPKRKAECKQPRPKPTADGLREPGHWSYSFIPPSEVEWQTVRKNGENHD